MGGLLIPVILLGHGTGRSRESEVKHGIRYYQARCPGQLLACIQFDGDFNNLVNRKPFDAWVLMDQPHGTPSHNYNNLLNQAGSAVANGQSCANSGYAPFHGYNNATLGALYQKQA